MTDPVHFLAFGFGTGLSPKAPGTVGSLVAFPFFALMHGWDVFAYAAALLLLFGVGVYLCGESARRLGEEDYGGIVWDEIVGMLITLYGLPWAWEWLLLGFVLFRFFDIVKPWPVSWSDRCVKGGLGIMLDDVLAGVYAALVIQGIQYVL